MSADVIDYEIHGSEMQFVEVELDPGESAVAEAGALMFMDAAIDMETVFGDGSAQEGGFFGKLVGAGKRLITGESLFTTVFTNNRHSKARVAFASPYPGKVVPLRLAELGGELHCQKEAFLCAARGVSLGIAFQKRIGVGMFGGEGFIMQKLSGDGLVFVHAGGTVVEKTLLPGEKLKVDTGCLVAKMPSVDMAVGYIGSVKSAVFGGEGFFLTELTGPGKVWLQSLPFSRLAGRIHQSTPQTGGRDTGEGTVMDSFPELFKRR